MRERQTIISFLIRGLTLLLISAASSWAVDVDMPISASADCLKNNYMSLDLKYHHGPAKCHKTEGIWTGDFLNTGQAEVCRPPEPLSTSIGQCNNTCCYICGGNDETHRNPLNNFAKPAIPGVYRQSISLTSLEEGKSITADVRVVFTPDGLGGLPVCASAQTAVNIPSEGSESDTTVNFNFTIQNFGQTTRLERVLSTDQQEVLVGGYVTVRTRVMRTVWSNHAPLDEPVPEQTVVFVAKSPSGGVFETAQAASDSQGYAEASFQLNSGDGEYKIDTSCTNCVANPNVIFTATALPIKTILEILPGEEGGAGQRDLVGTLLPLPIQVRVKDTDGTLRPDVAINFSEVSVPSPGSFSNATPVTDSKGIARTFYTLGNILGNYKLRAYCSICSHNPRDTIDVLQGALNKGTENKIRNNRIGGEANDTCNSWIIPESKNGPPKRSPDPEDDESVADPVPSCTGAFFPLKCAGVPSEEDINTCTQWFVLPLPESEGGPGVPIGDSVVIEVVPPIRAQFFSNLVGKIKVLATYNTLKNQQPVSCKAKRVISVVSFGAQSLSFDEFAEALGIKEGDTVPFTVTLQDVQRASDEEIKELINISVIDLENPSVPPGKVLDKRVVTVQSNGEEIKKLIFDVKFFELPQGAIYKDAIIKVTSCGDEKNADVSIKKALTIP